MLHLTTLFDKNYLSRALVLYESLLLQPIEFTLYTLCLDDFAYQHFANGQYKNIVPLHINELESADKELTQSKLNRSKVEYFFTISPCLPLYLLNKYNIPHICSLDADILFFSSPQHLFNNLQSHSIVVTPHKFAPEISDREKYGKYNVSFQIFKNDTWGKLCLEKWRTQCIEWCHDYLDEQKNRFADQKYLDSWPADYPGKVKILDDTVSGLAVWNVNNYTITKKGETYYSNGEKIVFYHYHAFKLLGARWASNDFSVYKVQPQKLLIEVYHIYWRKLSKKNNLINFTTDKSARQNLEESTLRKIVSSKGVFYYLSNSRLLLMDVNFLLNTFNKIVALRNWGRKMIHPFYK